MKIVHLPKPDELAYNLNKLSKLSGEELNKQMKSLATSVIDYSKQIEQIFGLESLQGEEDVIEEPPN